MQNSNSPPKAAPLTAMYCWKVLLRPLRIPHREYLSRVVRFASDYLSCSSSSPRAAYPSGNLSFGSLKVRPKSEPCRTLGMKKFPQRHRLVQGDLLHECPVVRWSDDPQSEQQQGHDLQQLLVGEAVDCIVMSQACDLEHTVTFGTLYCVRRIDSPSTNRFGNERWNQANRIRPRKTGLGFWMM
jgi:hypothetical protein